jgi:hypothetical protein
MATALPAPTADALTGGRWPHMRELRRELQALVSDLDPRHTTPGVGARDEAEAMVRAGWHRVMVGVYTPAAGRDEVMLGWYSQQQTREVIDRVVAHLPGARVPREALIEGSVMIEWGSRTPGWTPTAVPIRRSLSIAWREPGAIWTAQQSAEHCGIAPRTWSSYIARRDAQIPLPLGDTTLPGRTRPVPVWDRQAVIDWHAARPGKGGRPRVGAP